MRRGLWLRLNHEKNLLSTKFSFLRLDRFLDVRVLQVEWICIMIPMESPVIVPIFCQEELSLENLDSNFHSAN